MAAFPETSLSTTLIDIVERVLYGHSSLSFSSQSTNHVDQRYYSVFFEIIQQTLLEGDYDAEKFSLNYNRLRSNDDNFRQSTPDIADFTSPRSVFLVVAHLQNEWAKRSILFVANLKERMSFITMIVNAFYHVPRHLIKFYKNVNHELSDIYKDVCKMVATLTQRAGDTSKHRVDEGDLTNISVQLQMFLTASNYTKDIVGAAHLLSLPSVIERLANYVVGGYGMGAVLLDDRLIADLLLLFTVQKFAEEPMRSKLSQVSNTVKVVDDDDDDDDDEDEDEYVDKQRTHRFITITHRTVPARLLSKWLRLTRRQVITELSVDALDNEECTDVLQQIVNASPFLRRAHFVKGREDPLFFNSFIEKQPRLDELNRGTISQLNSLNIHHLHFDTEEFNAFRVTSLLNDQMPSLTHLHITIGRSINEELETCLEVLAKHPSLKSLEWTSNQSPSTNEGVYLELCKFIEKKAAILEVVRINIFPENPLLQDEFVWATLKPLEAINLLVLAVGISNDTTDGQNIYEYLRKNREQRLQKLLQTF